ncbi:hypothetical protein D3C75_795070 [compost metagenome]
MWRFQLLVDLVGLDPVGEQGDFQGVLGALAQTALAGEVGDIPEIRPGGRRLGQLVLVESHDHGPDIGRHAAFGQSPWHELRLIAKQRRVKAFEQARIAAAQQLGAFDFDHIPAGMADIDHGLDFRQLAIVFAGHHSACTTGIERLEISLVLGLLGSAAERDDGQALGLGEHAGAQQGQGKRYTGTQGNGHGTLPQLNVVFVGYCRAVVVKDQ